MSTCVKKSTETWNDMQDYYKNVLEGSIRFGSDVCSLKATQMMTKGAKNALSLVHGDIKERYFGCGLPLPSCLLEAHVLDLGCGTGRDVYLLSKMVGPNGHVTGIDMTDELLSFAKKYVDYHCQAFGYNESNVDFKEGYIEKLSASGIKANQFDVIVSNCVINLSPDKRSVLKEAYTSLKDGGEIFFSDMYANKPIPDTLKTNKSLWGDGLAGALTWSQLLEIAEEVGFTRPRLYAIRKINVNKPEYKELVGDIQYASITCRLFKLPPEASGKSTESEVKFNGTEDHLDKLVFDNSVTFTTGTRTVVDGNLAAILKYSRYAKHFSFTSLSTEAPPHQNDISDPFGLLSCK
ncbi:arsenite methyltransferase-like [Antedon mediterranea]|uniref:arsenite methyltransferase-like n=1 Tax=Antedon mediterranea TaxID=105859 RepID=UPI003AF67480